MFEELRKQAIEGELEQPEEDDEAGVPVETSHFLGMAPQQRFLLAVMLLMWISIMGVFCLLVSGRVGF